MDYSDEESRLLGRGLMDELGIFSKDFFMTSKFLAQFFENL